MGAEFVMMAQTIVSRQIAALDPTVLTVGTFHAGTKNNIIPDEAVLTLSMRAFSEEARRRLLDGVKRTADGIAAAYGVARERMPEVKMIRTTATTINDVPLSERMRKVAVGTLGAAQVENAPPVMASEDVGYFNLDGKIPFTMFRIGAADPEKVANAAKTGVALPSLHSALFAPVYEPTIRTGVTAMTAMTLDLLQK